MRAHLAEQEKAAQAEGVGGSSDIDAIGVRDLAGLLGMLWQELEVGCNDQA